MVSNVGECLGSRAGIGAIYGVGLLNDCIIWHFPLSQQIKSFLGVLATFGQEVGANVTPHQAGFDEFFQIVVVRI
jgi:hypothetical protein